MERLILRYPVVWVFAAVVAGVGIAEILPAPSWLWIALSVASAATTVVAWRFSYGVALAALLTLLAAGSWSSSAWQAPAPLGAQCESEQWRGVVDAAPRRAVNPVTGEMRIRTVLRDLRERCEERWEWRGGRVQVSLPGAVPLVRGDEILARLAIDAPQPPRNPTDRDGRVAARHAQLSARGVARGPIAVMRKGRGVLAGLDSVRAGVGERIEAALTRPRAAIVKALALGDRSSISAAMRDRWSRAGVAHLLAISGLHVGLLAWALFAALRAMLGRVPGLVERSSSSRVAAAATIPTVIVFCVWVGAPASAVRATIMAVAVLLGLTIGRRGVAANALGVAGAAIVLLSPSSIYDAGFLLSFAAVGALLMLPPPRHVGRPRLLRWLMAMVSASVAALFATAPVMASTFGEVSLVSPLTNLVAVPLATLVTVPLALLFALAPPLESVVAPLLEWSVAGLDRVTALADSVPGAAVSVTPPSPVEVVAYVVLLVGVAISLRRGQGRRWIALGGVMLVLAVGYRLVTPPVGAQLRVLHPYVGQGDAAVVIFPAGTVMVFDGGGAIDPGAWDPGRGVVGPMLRRLGIGHIDIMVVSHPDPDHLRGLLHVAERFAVSELWWSGAGEESADMTMLRELVDRHGGRARTAEHVPQQQDIDGVTVRWIHPRPDPLHNEGLSYHPELEDNDNSIVLHLQFGDRSVLLPGDLEADAEAMVAASLPHADVLKAPHHGSATSSTPAFLDAVSPAAVIISCGEHNRFGFPNPEVLARYRERGIEVLRTDTHGLIEMRTGGQRWRIEGYRAGSLTVGSP